MYLEAIAKDLKTIDKNKIVCVESVPLELKFSIRMNIN
jgi:hypothetical protein